MTAGHQSAFELWGVRNRNTLYQEDSDKDMFCQLFVFLIARELDDATPFQFYQEGSDLHV